MLLQGEDLEALVAAGNDAERSGDWTRALNQYSSALVQANEKGDFPRVCELLRAVGRLHFERGDYDHAAEAFNTSLVQATAANDPSQIAASLNALGVTEQFRGNVDLAAEFYSRASKLAEEIGDGRLTAQVEQHLGILATIRGDYDQAIDHMHNALAGFRSLGQDLASARVLNNIGMLQLDMSELGHADLSFRSAQTLVERLGDAALALRVKVNRAELAVRRQDFDAAHELCDAALRECTRLGSDTGLGETYKLYGMMYRELGDSPLSSTHLRLALTLAQGCGDRLLEAESERERALLHLQEGRNRDALGALTQAHRIFQELHARREVADIERKLERVEAIYLRVVGMLESEMAISLDPDAIDQYHRVAQYAAQLAEDAGLRGRDLNWLRIGAFLYDIGKRSVPANVLNKRGKLDASEWDLVKHHVIDSEQVVVDLDPPWDMRPMVRHHHEHWDGTGYPDALVGEEIPLAARVLCIADAFTALTSKRSFRPKMTTAQALDLMEREAGQTFDPALFNRFRALVEK